MKDKDVTNAAIVANSKRYVNFLKLEKMLKTYDKIKNQFSETNGKKYRKYGIKLLNVIFDIDPEANINDVNRSNRDETTFHHIKPQKEIYNDPQKMTDTNNLAPMTRSSHDQADKTNTYNGKSVRSIDQEKIRVTRKKKFQYTLLGFFDVLFTSFIFGFVYEFTYQTLSKIIKDEKIDLKTILISSIKKAYLMFLLSLPFALVIVPIALFTGGSSIITTIVQVITVLITIVFFAYMSWANSIRSGDNNYAIKRVIIGFVLRSIVFFFVAFGIEMLEASILLNIENIAVATIVKDIISSVILSVFVVFETLVHEYVLSNRRIKAI